MADTIANYTGNGTQTDFVVPFDYLKKSFVRVYLDSNTLLTGGDYGDTGADYYFLDDTTIRLKNAPAQDVLVTIRRYTSATERIVSFEDASILKATDLDTSQLQSFHIAEEARDNVNDAMLKNDEGAWDAQDSRISNVADPIDDQDAMTLGYYKKDKESVIAMRDEVEGYRDETLGFRDETEGFRDDALESKTLAKDWAVKTDGKVVENEVEVDYSAKYWAQSIKEMGESALIVADNIDDVNTVADNIGDVNIVGGDLEGSFKPPQLTDMGRVGTGNTEEIVITGGNIKTVADNITDVQKVGDLIDSGQVDTVINAVETTTANVTAAQQAQQLAEEARDKAHESDISAERASGIAKNWANYMDGTVDNTEYSAKYYAQQAKGYSDSASTTATDVTEAVSAGVQQITQAGITATNNINSAYSQATEGIESSYQSAVSEITTAKNSALSAVTTEGETQVGLIEDASAEEIAKIKAEGTTQVGLVNTAGETQVDAVDAAGVTHLNELNTAKNTAVKAVQDEAPKQVALVTNEGTKQVGLVTAEGNKQIPLVTSEGEAQVEAIDQAGTTQTKAVNTAGQTQTKAVNDAGTSALSSISSEVQKAKDWAEKTEGEVEAGAYSAKYWAQQAAAVGGQSDWEEADSSSLAYIKNKPDLSVYALRSEISTIYRYKGSVATYDQLPVASQVIGDSYNIATDDKSHGIKAGDNVVWNGTYWDNLSGYVDLSPYLTSEAASGIYLRQDTASNTYATKTEVDNKITSFRITDYGRVGT